MRVRGEICDVMSRKMMRSTHVWIDSDKNQESGRCHNIGSHP